MVDAAGWLEVRVRGEVGFSTGQCPSGQWDLAVNQTALPTGVQIPPGPPRANSTFMLN